MNSTQGKPDLLELARAQLDFAALNTGAPSVKQVLFKAQTIVPLAAHPPATRFVKPLLIATACCAMLALPWVPQRTVLSVAELQFDTRFTPSEAQQLIDNVVRGLMAQQALPGADYTPREDGLGQLTLRASSLALHGAELQQALAQALESGSVTPPAAYPHPVPDAVQAQRRSPLQLLLDHVRPRLESGYPSYYPAAKLATQTLRGEAVYRQELGAYLQQRGYQLTGFAFSTNAALLPAGCQFGVDAWPHPVAVGVKSYFKLTSYQRQELTGLVSNWLQTMNLRDASPALAPEPTPERPVVCTVRDRQGRIDPLLSLRLNAALAQQDRLDLADTGAVDDALSKAAETALPGIERRVDFERVSTREPWLLKIDVTMQGRMERDGIQADDPVNNSAVKEQF